VLAGAVDSDGYVNYGLIRRNRSALDRYVAWIARPGATRTGVASHAFHLNAFTALTILQVLERDVGLSVNEVPSLLPFRGAGFWYTTSFTVNGQSASLWDIGHEKVTHAFQDYRDLAALPVAARSGPPVRGELYDPNRLGDQLEDQMYRWLMDDRGMYFDGDTPVFNATFDRYGFELDLYTHGTDLCTLASFHTLGRRQRRLIEASERGCPHRLAPFDWSLNAPPRGTR
jgi:hypothetical protein